MAWLELTAILPSALAEICGEKLESLGAIAVSFLESGQTPLLEPAPGATPLWQDNVKVVGLFEDQKASLLQKALRPFFPEYTFYATSLAEQDWAHTWLLHFKPMQFGQHLWITPCQHQTPLPPQAVVVKLDPGLAFGTGTHPTTALCLTWLDQNPPQAKTLIDYGCGSGVLGIAALLLGAKTVWAVDHDQQALDSTQENAQRNRLSAKQLRITKPDALPTCQADIILANILAEPLIDLAPILRQHCAVGGQLILSGLLASQIEKVKKAYPHFHFAPSRIQEGWALLSATRQS